MKFEFENLLRIYREQGLLGFVGKCLLYLRFPFSVRRGRSILADHGAIAAVDYVFSVCAGLIKPLQEKEEILALLKAVEEKRPAVVLEIGTAVGGSLFLFSQAASPDAMIISVDLPGGKYGGGYPLWRSWLYRLFPRGRQRLFLVREDSHSLKTLGKIKRILGKKKVDFLFIDGDHTYNGVRSDFEMYSPLVASDGAAAFHDIVIGDKEEEYGVARFWREIKGRYNAREIVRDWSQGKFGIGLLQFGARDGQR